MLGLQVALADGTLVRVGGRTVKNKSGFDLVGIFVGAEGLLGLVTEITRQISSGTPTVSGLCKQNQAAAAPSIRPPNACANALASASTMNSTRKTVLPPADKERKAPG